MFHDSVDIIFDTKSVPIGFNILDFHGKLANKDFELINLMIK